MRNVSCLFVLSLCAAACGGSDSKPTSTAKKGPKQPKKLTTKPSSATKMGKSSTVKPPGGTSDQTLGVPGGGEVDVYAWDAEIDDSGQSAQCVGAFADDGSAAVACGPFTDTCDDGSELDAGLFVFYDASQDLGAFALAGSDLCGEGYDIVGCTFDGDGNVGDCGVGTLDGDSISISAE